MRRRTICLILAMAMTLAPFASAKTTPAGETVGNALFYVTNDKGASRDVVSALTMHYANGRAS